MTPQARRTLRNAALGLLTAACLLGAAEAALRLLSLPPPGLYEGDPATVWWLRPDLERAVPAVEGRPGFRVKTNGLGLRGPLPHEDPWTLALGCSTTFGWGVDAEEAWPAQLSALLGETVVNGGVPGWSSHQARLGSDRYLAQGPSRVVLGFLVRDAWHAETPDALARPTPWPLRTSLGRLLARSGARGRSLSGVSLPAFGPPEAARVSPDALAQNLTALAAQAAPAEVWVLAFPTLERDALSPWLEAMRRTGLPVLDPVLPDASFFPRDPVHLTPAGHRVLAESIAESLRAEG